MTVEELQKEADEAFDKRIGTIGYVNKMNTQTPYTDGYKDGVKSREKHIADLEKENAILKKALNLYVTWADECHISWEDFPDMEEKWYDTVAEKGLGWIDGLVFMVTEEAKEQLEEEKLNK